MAQTWKDLLFAHWEVPAHALERLVPPPLVLDRHEGSAWIGVTPFAVRNLRPRLTLPAPVLSAFPEINVRTYVTFGGRPGIYFLSLDAGSALAVGAARRLYRLPYFRARMAIAAAGGAIRYSSARIEPHAPAPATFEGRYRPRGEPFEARPGTLEHWLCERYCLYTFDERRRPLRADIHHPPWPLQDAEAEIAANTMAIEAGLALDGEPLLHYARRQDVVFWSLARA